MAGATVTETGGEPGLIRTLMMEMTMTRHAKPRSKRPLTPEQLARREAVLTLYRDMGPGRTYERLIEMARPKHGLISRRTLVNWARAHSWRARIDEHDRKLTLTPEAGTDEFDPDFDMQGAWRKFMQKLLRCVLVSNPVVRTPQDAKTLLDTVERAARLLEMLKAAGNDPQQVAANRAQMFEALRRIEARVRAVHKERAQLEEAQQALREGRIMELPPMAAELALEDGDHGDDVEPPR